MISLIGKYEPREYGILNKIDPKTYFVEHICSFNIRRVKELEDKHNLIYFMCENMAEVLPLSFFNDIFESYEYYSELVFKSFEMNVQLLKEILLKN